MLDVSFDDPNAEQRTKRAKKATKKRQETISDGFERVRKLKLTEEERRIVDDVERLLRQGELTFEGRLSKKAVFTLYAEHREIVKERKRRHVVDTRPSNYWIVQDALTLERVATLLASEPITAWDTETTGLDLYNDRIVGWSAYLPNADIAVYVPFGHTTGQTQVNAEDAFDVARRYLSNPSNKTIWHNYKYDGHMFLNHGINVENPYWDTQVASKLLNENETSHRLKNLHARYVKGDPDGAILFEDLFDDHVIYDKDVILSGIYAAGDAEKTYALYKFQKPYIDGRDRLHVVWYEIEQPLLAIDVAMEREGFRIDLERLEALRERFDPILKDAEHALITAFNINDEFIARMSESLGRQETEFNVNSNQHLAYLIYDVLGVDDTIGLRFKKALRSTAADVVDAICDQHADLEPLLRYRTLKKLLSTYIEKIPKAIEPSDGRLHVRFNNMSSEDDSSSGAATGRYSSSTFVSGKNSRTGDVAKGTNIQNIPSKGEGIEIRRCFIPDDGWLFIGSDLSKIEPVIISHILAEQYGDTAMRDMFIAGVDIYAESAVQTFGFDREYCVDGAKDPTGTFYPRKLSKQGVLSYLYGSSAKSFARNMGVTEDVAQAFFDGMLSAFPGLVKFREDVIDQLLTNGTVAHVETLFGRKRRFPDYRRDKTALNKIEATCYASGLEIYRNKPPKGKTPEKQAEIDGIVKRLRLGTLTADDKDAITRTGLYWRHKDLVDERSELWRKVARAERQALNAIIQGSAADILKRNIIALYAWCRQNGFKLLASIHDEVWLSLPKTAVTPENVAKVTEIMTQTVKLSVPLLSDTVIQRYWMDENRPADWDFEKQQPKEAA